MAQENQQPPAPRNQSGTVRIFVLAELVLPFLLFITGLTMVVLGAIFTYQLTAIIGGVILFMAMWVHMALMMYRLITYQIAALKEISPTIINLHRLLTQVFKAQ